MSSRASSSRSSSRSVTSMPMTLIMRSSPSSTQDSIPGIQPAMPPKSPTTAHTSSAGRSMSISARALPIAPPSFQAGSSMPRLAQDGLSGLEVEHAVGELLELVGERRRGDHGAEYELREPDVDEFS